MHRLRLTTVLVLLTVLGSTGIGLLRARAYLVINTNVASLEALRHLGETQAALQKSYQRLSSGLRINSAADDAAGLAVSERMRASVRSLGQASRNAQDAVSLVQTAEGAYSEIANILVRLRELAVQSANGTLMDRDREQIHTEYEQLLSEITRLSRATQFNSLDLVSSFSPISLQVGERSRRRPDIARHGRLVRSRTSHAGSSARGRRGKAVRTVESVTAPEIIAGRTILRESLERVREEVRGSNIEDFDTFDEMIAALLRANEEAKARIVETAVQLNEALKRQDEEAQRLLEKLEAMQSEEPSHGAASSSAPTKTWMQIVPFSPKTFSTSSSEVSSSVETQGVSSLPKEWASSAPVPSLELSSSEASSSSFFPPVDSIKMLIPPTSSEKSWYSK